MPACVKLGNIGRVEELRLRPDDEAVFLFELILEREGYSKEDHVWQALHPRQNIKGSHRQSLYLVFGAHDASWT